MIRKILVLTLLLAIVGSAPAATIGNWGTGGAGQWGDPTKWSAGEVPVPTTATGDEIKIQTSNADVTIDEDARIDYIQRLTTGNETTGVVLRVVDGDVFGMGEFRVGAKPSSTRNGTAVLYQTGGTLTVNDMVLGRGAGSSVDASVANGTYEISGGTLQYRSGGAGRLYVGAGNNTSVDNPVESFIGNFTVIGNAATINVRKLYVGSDGTRYGMGTVEFRVG